ncbi:hypothetical protein BVRB_1g017800 [Beta vulgaris subsp. vulgaris]|nr:hypothetical protein BVRB_1g017800 [Beta vulgaris subsp. vulgaris]
MFLNDNHKVREPQSTSYNNHMCCASLSFANLFT